MEKRIMSLKFINTLILCVAITLFSCEKKPEIKKVPVLKVTLDKHNISIVKGMEETLNAIVLPQEADNKNVSWKSNNDKIATVDSNGKVTGVELGEATITATTEEGNFSVKCEVTVINDPKKVVSITLEKKEITLREMESTTLTTTILPETAENKKVTWKSSNEAAATVDTDGKVSALKVGEATITVTTDDGNKSASCIVKVERRELSYTTDSLALVAIYNATDGANWREEKREGWLKPGVPINKWEGVTIKSDEYDENDDPIGGRVIELNLAGAGMIGNIPDDISMLSELTALKLQNNKDGLKSIPSSIAELTKLTEIHIHNNPTLTGIVLQDIVKLINLIRLNISRTSISGSIPSEIGNLKNLNLLVLNNAQIEGEIPPEIGNLNKLRRIDLKGNRLTGKVPETLKAKFKENFFNPQQEGFGLEY